MKRAAKSALTINGSPPFTTFRLLLWAMNRDMQIEFEDQGGVPRRQLLWLMNQELVRNGIFTLGAFILCFSHDRRDLRRLERAINSAMLVVRQAVAPRYH